jgi:hypothetical protein
MAHKESKEEGAKVVEFECRLTGAWGWRPTEWPGLCL